MGVGGSVQKINAYQNNFIYVYAVISFHCWKWISKFWKAERETEKTMKAE